MRTSKKNTFSFSAAGRTGEYQRILEYRKRKSSEGALRSALHISYFRASSAHEYNLKLPSLFNFHLSEVYKAAMRQCNTATETPSSLCIQEMYTKHIASLLSKICPKPGQFSNTHTDHYRCIHFNI